MISLLRHAHVTGVAIIGSCVLSYIWGHSTRNVRNIGGGGASSSLLANPTQWVLDYLSFPFPGALPREWIDAGALVAIFLQCRVLERHWGTARFLTVSLLPMLLSTIILSTVAAATSANATPLHHPTTPWVAVATALAYRYYRDIPSLARNKYFNGAIVLSDKFLLYLAMFKILIAPLTVFADGTRSGGGRGAGRDPATSRWQQISLHVALALLGVAVSAALRRFPHFTLLPNHGRLMNAFRASTATAFGPQGEARHSIPAPTAAQQQAMGQGQVLVDDPRHAGPQLHRMAHPRAQQQQAPVGGAPPAAAGGAAPATGGTGGDYGGTGSNMGAGFGSGGGLSQEDLDVGVATIMSLGIPNVTVEKAVAALKMSSGNVDQAVGQLMEQM